MTGHHRDLGGGVRGSSLAGRHHPSQCTGDRIVAPTYRRILSGPGSPSSLLPCQCPPSFPILHNSSTHHSQVIHTVNGIRVPPLPAFEKIPLEANSRPGISVCPRSMYSRTSNGSKVKNKREGRGDVIYNGGRKGRKIGGVKEKATGERGKNWRGIRYISKSAEDQYMRVQTGLFVSFV